MVIDENPTHCFRDRPRGKSFLLHDDQINEICEILTAISHRTSLVWSKPRPKNGSFIFVCRERSRNRRSGVRRRGGAPETHRTSPDNPNPAARKKRNGQAQRLLARLDFRATGEKAGAAGYGRVVANKLARMLWTMMKTGERFRAEMFAKA